MTPRRAARLTTRARALGAPALVVVALLLTGCSGATASPPAASRSAAAAPAPVSRPSSPPRPLQVVGLGDSVTAGTACDCEDFVDLYAEGLSRRWHRTTRATNLGQGGLTSDGLLAAVEDDGTERADIASADVVLVTIGANDLMPALHAWDDGSGQDERTCGGTCGTTDLDRVGRTIQATLAAIDQLRGGRRTLVLVTTYWNVFEDGDVAAADRGQEYLRWSDGLTRRLNERIAAAARATGAVPVDLYAAFKGDGADDPTALLAGDGDHPNAAGHRVIAEALLTATPETPAR
ncbi:MAG TPA: SGNH/GDSL hydrolase family protein [Actinomycetales bacterium]|nr:SGNH/GDSL hydrolase family protein [Actinomycetales bacterium]